MTTTLAPAPKTPEECLSIANENGLDMNDIASVFGVKFQNEDELREARFHSEDFVDLQGLFTAAIPGSQLEKDVLRKIIEKYRNFDTLICLLNDAYRIDKSMYVAAVLRCVITASNKEHWMKLHQKTTALGGPLKEVLMFALNSTNDQGDRWILHDTVSSHPDLSDMVLMSILEHAKTNDERRHVLRKTRYISDLARQKAVRDLVLHRRK